MPGLDEPQAGEHLEGPAYGDAAATERRHKLMLGRQPCAGRPSTTDNAVSQLFKDLLLDAGAPYGLQAAAMRR
jgi:hypothetical protein